MANGYTTNRFNYESPVDRLLNYTIPTFLDKELDRQADDDRFDLLRQDRLDEQEYEKGQDTKRWNEEVNRYDAKIAEDNDDDLYERGWNKFQAISSEQNIQKKLTMLETLKSTPLHSDVNDVVEARISGLKTQLKDVETNMSEFSPEIYNPSQLSRIKNQFMLGNIEGAHQVGDKMLTDQYSTPWIKTESLRIRDEIKSVDKRLDALIGLDTDDVSKRRGKLNEDKIALRGQLADLYDQDRPFDPKVYGNQFNTNIESQLKEAGLEIKDQKSADALFGKYSGEIKAFRQEYLTGPKASDYTPKQRDDAAQKVINDIIAKEKISPPIQDPQFNYENLNKLDAQGTALALAATAYALKNPAKKVYDYMGKKTVQAAGAVKEVWNMPASDITKFLHNVALDTPGKPGAMMPKVEKLLDEINKFSGERKTPKVKKELADLNAELDKQVKKVMKRFRQLKVSPALNDASLEKLIRNPNKWRLAKIKSLLSKPKALAPSMRKWGVFSASAKIGEALGDPTGGIATGIGLPAVAKKVINIYKKKGPKWFMAKLTPVVGKAISKRIVGGVASGAIGGPAVVATTIGGTGLAIHDIYKFLESLSEGGSEEEAAAILQSAVQRDSTQAPIDSTRMRRDSTGIVQPFNPDDPDSLLFQTLAR